MKTILLAASFAVLANSAVHGADMAARPYAKAPAYVAPVYNWTGFYVGAHLGGAFSGNENQFGFGSPLPFTFSNDSGFLGGGQVGADYQFAPNWVIGIEGQVSGLDYKRNFTAGGALFQDKTDWLASVTGRLGYTWGPGLIYAKGGVAFRDNGGFSANVGSIFVTRNDTGYTVGGGLEYMFAPSWSAKLEYQYYNFEQTLLSDQNGPFARYTNDLHTVKAGLNYRFNWGGPVVAKY